MAILTEDEKVFKLVVLLWGQFNKGADMDVAHDCIDEAISKGALQNIRDSVDMLYDIPDGTLFQAAMTCSLTAGQKARETATRANSSCITRDMFRDAFDDVSGLMARGASIKSHGTATILGGICNPV